MSNRIQKSSQKASGLTCICASCGKHLRDKHSLNLHRMAKHASQFYPCTKCDEHFSLKTGLNKHMEQIHGEIRNKCEECDRTYANVQSYKSHVKNYHGTFPCSHPGCKRKLSTLKSLNCHIDSHVREFPCKICEKSFTSKAGLVVHMDSIHAEYSCRCSVEGCDAKFAHPTFLRAHIMHIHEIKNQPETVCKLCGHDFRGLKRDLRRHMETIHWLDSFKEKFGKPQKEGEEEDAPESHHAPMKLTIKGAV
ncbi:uncharacterized protein EAF01_009827 [Botrytis porri]|uniref:uncharacterized protein n=1 Tax=Botrytis porri TaxID=87229 RepID=UPI0018FF203E|nr:uncharacterized protein EAF01_009827 [Botrytis porri]KAF7894376.1 hypothetical protein EAF01_009827 [Botrytis porri]